MKLHILGSSSRGNGYILEASDEAIILECGEPARMARSALGYSLSKVKGVFITHEHQDHSKFARSYAESYIPIYATGGTIEALGAGDYIKPICLGKEVHVGRFKILPFSTQHDANEPCGFLIDHPESGIILFATDTYYIKYRVPEVKHLLVECNYSEEILQHRLHSGEISIKRYERTYQSHMSLSTCMKYIDKMDKSRLHSIVLLHLSEENSHAEQFAQSIQSISMADVYVADRGMTIRLT